mmetsp:Transcript_31337/g.100528  ORF Transcript_31337/g.100528 Transcript_31337/m.100528 type:complete len:98 (-) Transcript_31337:162-455(-)
MDERADNEGEYNEICKRTGSESIRRQRNSTVIATRTTRRSGCDIAICAADFGKACGCRSENEAVPTTGIEGERQDDKLPDGKETMRWGKPLLNRCPS